MRSMLPLAALALALGGASVTSAADLAEARKVAARENKPVLVDFFATW